MSLTPTAILVPSLNRAHRLVALAANIHDATPEPHRLLFCVSDIASMQVLDSIGESYIDDSEANDHRYVTRMNLLWDHVTEPTVFCGADDVTFHPGWLSAALDVMHKGPSVVITNDLRNRNGTLALVRSDYIATHGGTVDGTGAMFHAGYLHNYADNELFYTAHVRGVLARAPRSIVEHHHPVFGRPGDMPWDDTYRNAQAGWAHDEQLWQQRVPVIESCST